ncbi:LysR family transcriptional regulator [Stackebrandtia soli]|uniref:LysR family transcriptional regulator n=1 Tax=Stackebrandtia soli TaxID=1892856 RepID=UPI0039E78C9F
MELQQLRYVLAIAETRNFTRAARQCHVVQSALSHQVKALERELGVTLFARTSRRVELTVAGEAFLPHAQAALDAAERASAEAVSAATGQIRGSLVLGLIPTVTAFDLPAVLREYHHAHPLVRIALREAGSHDLIEAVIAGEIDVAVLGLPESTPPSGVRVRELARERHVAVVSVRHRFAGRKRLALEDLADERFADFIVGSGGRAQCDVAFESAGLTREVVFEAASPDLICRLIEQDLAVALLPPALLARRPGLVAIPVTSGPSRIQFLAWSDFNPSPATSAFLDLV